MNCPGAGGPALPPASACCCPAGFVSAPGLALALAAGLALALPAGLAEAAALAGLAEAAALAGLAGADVGAALPPQALTNKLAASAPKSRFPCIKRTKPPVRPF